MNAMPVLSADHILCVLLGNDYAAFAPTLQYGALGIDKLRQHGAVILFVGRHAARWLVFYEWKLNWLLLRDGIRAK